MILGSTGTGKTKLSIDLAIRFSGEIINSDKIHAQKGLDIASNRVTKAETKGIPHHILEVVGSDADFTIQDFVTRAHDAIDHITSKGRLPIIVGCSNSYIEALVEGHYSEFRSRIDPCFLWIDIDVPVLYRVVEARVDRMIRSGLLDEVRDAFINEGPKDVTRGVWRTIGFEEFQTYFEAIEGVDEMDHHDEVARKELFDVAVKSMKERTCKLVDRHLGKIQRLRDVNGWDIHRIDATKVVVAMENNGGTEADSWEEVVLKPSYEIVSKFLDGGKQEGEVVVPYLM
ncbi:unnamed protein product [Linum tenue]|uniref:Uncharacterized protein n=1 Tax=Linum tenue TaxID=586396 RepID=A0AAV0PKJ5_9ROSI|nr:unnamed protein product [Linum tenue]